jgi:hypothetical protein
MTGQRTTRHRVALVLALASALGGLTLEARQRDNTAELRDRLRERFDILALQDGVALVPRQRDDAVRLVEVREGTVAVNGEEVTGRQLRDRLGRDAELVLRLTYLSAEDQRRLAASGRAEAAPPAPAPTPPGAAPPTPPAPPAPPAQQPEPIRTVRRDGEMVRVFSSITIPRNERVNGDLVVVFGNAYIDGEVDGEVTVVMGNVYLREDSVIREDLTVVGGRLNRAPGARVEGRVDSVTIGDERWRGGWSIPAMLRDTIVGRVGSLVGTLVRVTLLALLSLIAVAFGHNTIVRIADRTAADPLRAGLVGFFAQLLFFPVLIIAILVLAISIIGIPLLLLLPFVFLLALITLVVGFTGVAYQVGRMLNDRFGWSGRGTYATVLVGVVMIAAVTLVARSAAIVGGGLFSFPLSAVGYLVEYAAWTLGLGAAILAWMRSRDTPPPLPV